VHGHNLYKGIQYSLQTGKSLQTATNQKFQEYYNINKLPIITMNLSSAILAASILFAAITRGAPVAGDAVSVKEDMCFNIGTCKK
jgi:hypothetical protein